MSDLVITFEELDQALKALPTNYTLAQLAKVRDAVKEATKVGRFPDEYTMLQMFDQWLNTDWT